MTAVPTGSLKGVNHSIAAWVVRCAAPSVLALLAIRIDIAHAETTRLVAVDSAGHSTPPGSFVHGLSKDGRYILFSTAATDLVPDDTNGLIDLFVRDRLAGTTTRISVTSSGEQANAQTVWASLSEDGLHAAFVSSASNLVADDTNAQQDVFVHDLPTGETHRVSIASDGEEGNGPSGSPSWVLGTRVIAISGDGRFVCFPTLATNISSIPANVFCIHDRADGSTHAIAACASLARCNAQAMNAAISADGGWIALALAYPAAGHAVFIDLYLADRLAGELIPVSTDQTVSLFSGPSLSSDGRYLAFNTGFSQVFDRVARTSTVASIDSSGEPAGAVHSVISPDGRFLVFLHQSPGSEQEFLFRRDLWFGETALLAPHTYAYNFWTLFASDGASTVAFNSNASLVAGDVNTFVDGYTDDAVTLSDLGPANGSEVGGESVNLFGGWFAGAAGLSVRVGDVAAQVLDIEGTRVRVLTPPGSGTVDVTVSTGFDSATLASAYTYLAPEIAARYGNVNVGRGDREDVLLFNATTGDRATRIASIGAGLPISIVMLPPSSRASARYVLYGWSGLPSAATLEVVPQLVGAFVFPTPFTGGAPQPRVVWNVLGHRRTLGAPTLPSHPAPSVVIARSHGAPASARFTLQGLIEDDASPSGIGVSVTNALLVRAR
ncbi:MAG: hypothetical protein HYR85_13905 [Planctomycetes bacterium]|nr:hypothetical protein [Planctomycetota bacterium]MBI3843579.1 hypothetical protein [Planctomycetota bacterium]